MMVLPKRLAIAFCAMLLAVSLHAESPIRAKVMWSKGRVSYSMMGEDSGLVPMMSIPEGTSIRTSPESQVLLGVMPGVNVLVRADSEIILKELGYYSKRTGFVYNALVEVKKGSILADVKELIQPSRFRVKTKQGVFETNNGSLFVSYRNGSGFVGIFGGQCKATLLGGKEYVVLSASALDIKGDASALIGAEIVAFRYDELLEIQKMVEKINIYSEKTSQAGATSEGKTEETYGEDLSSTLLATPIFNDLVQAIIEEVPNTNNVPPVPPVSPVSGP